MGPNLRYRTVPTVECYFVEWPTKNARDSRYFVLHVIYPSQNDGSGVCLFVSLLHFGMITKEAKKIFVGDPKHQAGARCGYFLCFSSSIILWNEFRDHIRCRQKSSRATPKMHLVMWYRSQFTCIHRIHVKIIVYLPTFTMKIGKMWVNIS